MKKILVIVLMLLMAGTVQAQKSEVMLANEYYAKGDYEKAQSIYEKLFKNSATQSSVYEKYVALLTDTKQYDKAESVCKTMSKKFPAEVLYKIDLLNVYRQSGNTKDYTKTEEKFYKQVFVSEDECRKVFEILQTKKQYDFSKQLIDRYRKASGNQGALTFELVTVYELTKNKEALVDELMNVLYTRLENISYVQNRLQNNLADEKEFAMLETKLLKFVQERPEITEYSELLIWLYVQRREFSMAFLQSKALDKRIYRNGQKILELAQIAYENADYMNTIKIAQYNVDNYKTGMVYMPSRNLMVKAREQYIRNSYPVQTSEIMALITEYKGIVNEFGKRSNSAEALRSMAILYAFYLNRTDTAIVLLNEAIAIPNPDRVFTDRCKLDLGDMYILNDEPWESVLIYGQVEKSQKDQPLGYEAKLRNAKLSFYKGEFLWAQDQLDVLKLATTREIANDAISLSLLIQDNLGEDSITTPLEMYADADLMFFKHQYDAALGKLNSIQVGFPNHAITDEIYYQKARIFNIIGKYDEAIAELQKIVEKYDTGIFGDDSYFLIAEIYDLHKKDSAKAMEFYKNFIDKYPGSVYIAEARKRFRTLRGDKLN